MGRRAEGWKLECNTSGYYRVRFTWQGRRYQPSTGQRDRAAAALEARRIYADITAGREPQRRLASHRIETVAGAWLEAIESDVVSGTWATYEVYAGHWMRHFHTLDRMSAAGVKDYCRQRLKVVTRVTLTKELSAMRRMLEWCEDNELGAMDPHDVRCPPRNNPGTRYPRDRKLAWQILTEEQVEALIAHAPVAIRARLIVLWETGLRPATVARLRVDDLQGDWLRIRNETDKARYGRRVKLTARARATMLAIAPEVGVVFGPYDLNWLCTQMRRAAKAAGLPAEIAARVSAYDFRHSRITWWAGASNDLKGIQQLAGHKHATTTAKYIHPSEQDGERVITLSEAVSAGPIVAQRRARKGPKQR